VLWEKAEMAPLFIFSFKTNVPPCHPTRVGVPMQHLSPEPYYFLCSFFFFFFFFFKF